MKIFAAPVTIKEPTFALGWEAYEKAEKEYVQQIKDFAKKNGSGPYRGEEVNFPHADGYARYIVFKPTQLIHINSGDAWHYPHIERLLVKDIVQAVERGRAMRKLFAAKK